MAEAWTRKLFPFIEAFSAGLEPHALNPYALKVMSEKGIDLSQSQPQKIDAFLDKKLDFVVTVCDRVSESCQVNFSDCKVLHKNFDGPSKIARTKTTEEERLDCFRQVRDEIHTFIEQLPKFLGSSN
jgi:arsenate reductase